jgi:hypothetical protein
MTESAPVDASAKKAPASSADGISELVMGVTWMLWGVLIGLPQLLPQGGWTAYYWVAVPILLAGSGFYGQSVIRRLRERWSPRGSEGGKARALAHGQLWAVPLVSMMSAVVVAGFMTSSKNWYDFIPLGCSILVAGGLVLGLGRRGVPGAAFYAALSVGLGIAIVRGRMAPESGFALLWSGVGLAMTLGGAWRLFGHLRKRG